jgi:hypothetical protein
LLFVEHNGTFFLGPLAAAGRARLNNEGNSVLRLVNANQDEIVASETRALPVNPNRVWCDVICTCIIPSYFIPNTPLCMPALPFLSLPSKPFLSLSLPKLRSKLRS